MLFHLADIAASDVASDAFRLAERPLAAAIDEPKVLSSYVGTILRSNSGSLEHDTQRV